VTPNKQYFEMTEPPEARQPLKVQQDMLEGQLSTSFLSVGDGLGHSGR
jgi:hypothetical protein